jgi:6-phosphogluconolactonase
MHKTATLIMLVAFNATIHAASYNVYFGTGGGETKGIYQSQFNSETGKLSNPELAAEIGSPGFLALHPDGTKLYAVCNSGGPSVAAFRIDSEGNLKAINTQPIGDGGGAHISVHPSGKFLLTAQYGGGSAALFPIAEDGSIEPRKQLVEHEGGSRVVGNRQDTPHPHWTGYSPDSRFAFVPDLGKDQILIYRVSSDVPSITPHGHAQSVPGGGPRHMKFSVDGRFIYLLNELSLSVTTFAYNSQEGTTTRRSTTPALSEETKAKEAFNSASEILTHPNGKFVYSANRGNDSITVYSANRNTGQLKVSEVESIRGSWPRNINLDPTGKWLLAAGAHSNTISIFAIDQETGNLTFQTRGMVNVPGPICILFNE